MRTGVDPSGCSGDKYKICPQYRAVVTNNDYEERQELRYSPPNETD